MLAKIATAGQNGQFRTPRHIIRLMVEMVAPKPTDVLCDPASGTSGFLVAAGEYLRERHPESFATPNSRATFIMSFSTASTSTTRCCASAA
jgi:type I restriction enzyme M protein